MIINMHQESTESVKDSAVFKVLVKLAEDLSADYKVPIQHGRLFLLQDAMGRELFCQMLKDKFNLEIKPWHWQDSFDKLVGIGFDITESPEFTKLVLQHS